MDKKMKSGSQRSKKYSKNKSNVSKEKVRCPCDCEATNHPLVNNCINCGRIVCLNEGPGPCFFCGNIVAYQYEPLSSENLFNESASTSNNGNENDIDGKSAETLKLRNRLLEYDKNCASRTSVIDDECDYFQFNNTWLTKKQREQWEKLSSNAHDQKHRSRLNHKLSVDLMGQVHEEQDDPLELINKINAIQVDSKKDHHSPQLRNTYEEIKSVKLVSTKKLPSNSSENADILYSNRIQDKTYLEVLDQGFCLSMHQPYASLLVRGIKKTEERTWYSAHRGRLWIAATSKEPSPDDIKLHEESYQSLSKEKIEFPKKYPVGCLIGCVNVTDVLSEAEYNEKYPDTKTDSPYIFICENFIELPLKFPIQGKHKIYKLEKVLHHAVLNCLNKICLKN